MGESKMKEALRSATPALGKELTGHGGEEKFGPPKEFTPSRAIDYPERRRTRFHTTHAHQATASSAERR
jgi:hypothetical protein